MAPAPKAPEEKAYRHPHFRRLTLFLPGVNKDAQFTNFVFRSSDPAVQAEIEGPVGQAAGVYEDDEVETLRCNRCEFVTISKRALEAHRRSEHS